MAAIAKKISQESISNVIDYKINYIEELNTRTKIIPGEESGFSLTRHLVILWYQKGDDVVRANFWRKNQVKITQASP